MTLNGVHYLRVQNNLAYNIKGHALFLENSIETNNLIEDNLIIQTVPSWSLLNTDQTPASFWITNPSNTIRGNHAAGSPYYGFWFDLRTQPNSPSPDL